MIKFVRVYLSSSRVSLHHNSLIAAIELKKEEKFEDTKEVTDRNRSIDNKKND